MGTPEGTLGTPDISKILETLWMPAIPETPDTTELLENPVLQAFTRNSCISVHSTYLPIFYLRLIVAILKIEISSLMNWIFFLF